MKFIYLFVHLCFYIKFLYGDNKIKEFENFIVKYNKQYEHDEFNYRYQIFSKNYDLIKMNNIYNSNYKLEMNEFTDLHINEFENKYLQLKENKSKKYEFLNIKNEDLNCEINNDLLNENKILPTEFDWEKNNKVTCVKNQGNCGSCWAFSTIGAIESLNAIKNNKLISLSPQELVDCATDDYENKGCHGGLMENGFHYVMDKGLCSEKDYPYEGIDDTCMNCKEVVKIIDCKNVPAYNETALKYALFENPISVAVDAGSSAFQFYSSGILNSGCGANLNHGVLLVGYGEEDGEKFWRIKNSWGKEWGENGYIRISRKDLNTKSVGMCGITKKSSYPIM